MHVEHTEQWMLLCRAYLMLESQMDLQEEHNWNVATQRIIE